MLNWAVLNSVLSTIEHSANKYSANKYSAKLYLVHYLAQPNSMIEEACLTHLLFHLLALFFIKYSV